MKHNTIKAVDAILSGGFLIASILALISIGIGAVFAISMSGSWLPVRIFGIPILTVAAAVFHWSRRERVRENDEMLNALSWRREAVNGILILTVAAVAWFLHTQTKPARESQEQPRTEAGADRPAECARQNP